MGDIVSIAIWQDRKDGYPPLTEKQEAFLRGYNAWKLREWKRRKAAEKTSRKHPTSKPRTP